ncbi:hypothetical protein ACFPER_16645 [Agromyces aurantiacus]|uniref:Tachylectin 2 domain-containing protein n=1 Tax=Agromyces aurantiacus TaxID=165814 RepID=A0ABV9RE43_9MICO|nr:hypothetical protein [Agromyces aurantiacus]MBM7504679.1 hypothetical protein [Agromyces aurantiacus]
MLNGEELWLSYDSASGASTTGRLAPDGTVSKLRDFPLDPSWNLILPADDGMTLFYRGSDDHVSTGRFGPDGSFTDLVTSSLGIPFHRVTVLSNGFVMWNTTVSEHGEYRSASAIGRVFDDGRHEFISERFPLDFWTHIVHVGENRILFYNAQAGLAATGVVTGDGGYHDFGNSFHFDPWTQIESVGDGKVLFYNYETGLFASGAVSADGGFVDLFSEQVGSVSFLPTSRGRYVLFRSADTLATRLDDGGVFTDTVVVRGLPEGRRTAFVR